MNVYVVKVDIKRNGTSIVGQNPTVSVGELISLTGCVEPATVYGSSPMWFIDNSPIENYITSTSGGYVAYLESSDYLSNSINYYWYNGSEDVYVGYSVIINGSSWGIDTYFDVKKPTATTTVTRGPIRFDPDPPSSPTQLYNGQTANPGIGLTYTNPQTYGISGTYKWIQLLDSTLRRVYLQGDWIKKEHVTNAVTPRRLDNGDTNNVFFTGTNFFDSPSIGLFITIEGITYELEIVQACDHFVTWLMFQPSTSNSIAIPIKQVSWYWDSAASTNGTWTITKSLLNDDLSMSTSNSFPIWSGTVKQLGWVND